MSGCPAIVNLKPSSKWLLSQYQSIVDFDRSNFGCYSNLTVTPDDLWHSEKTSLGVVVEVVVELENPFYSKLYLTAVGREHTISLVEIL